GPRAVQLRAELLREQQLSVELHALAHQLFPLCILANTGNGRGLHITFGNPDLNEWRPGRLTSFHEIALHLAVAWRLRTALNAARRAVGSCRSEAPAGAGAALSPSTARDALRRAVEEQGRARDPQRSPGDALWPALVAGQWSLLDSFSA